MRTIRFRWKLLDNGEWVYGDLVHTTKGTIDLATVGQYTELKDKNGQEIYEDDIIECIASDNKPIRHLVRYNYEKGGYSQLLFMGNGLTCELYDGGLISQNYICEMGKYIIGNIHDNPELLKGGEQ